VSFGQPRLTNRALGLLNSIAMKIERKLESVSQGLLFNRGERANVHVKKKSDSYFVVSAKMTQYIVELQKVRVAQIKLKCRLASRGLLIGHLVC
jgi:hypothetical protein